MQVSHTRPISNNTDKNKIVVSNKVSFGKKNFKKIVGYKNATKIRPLCIFLLKINAYRRNFDETKYVFFDK